jgi:hypothetical protein
MKRRIERRYLSQLITGCGKGWCRNEYCKTGKSKLGKGSSRLTTQEALPMVKPLTENLTDHNAPMFFCVDEVSQKRRSLAEMLAAENMYVLEWCIAACEASSANLDSSRTWLTNWAPKIV